MMTTSFCPRCNKSVNCHTIRERLGAGGSENEMVSLFCPECYLLLDIVDGLSKKRDVQIVPASTSARGRLPASGGL